MKEAERIIENIKRLRKKKGWSQADLAEKTKTTLGHINKMETGKYLPSVDGLIKIANAFEVTLDYLVSEDNENFDEVKIEDRSFSQKIKLLDSLDPEDKQALTRVIDSMLTKKKILHLVSNGQNEPELIKKIKN